MSTSQNPSDESGSEPLAVDVVAIDGPSGAGKSTVARQLAEKLGFAYLDTGAMYRAVTWHLLENQFTDLADLEGLRALLADLRLQLEPDGRVLLNGQDVTNHLRSREVESRVSGVSAIPLIRDRMRSMQREIATSGPVVAEGRDMSSVVFPGAKWKFYLDAEPEERARRRHQDFKGRGRKVSEEEVLDEIAVRDRLDSTRQDAPLTRAHSADYIDTTGLDIASVVDVLRERVVATGGSEVRS
ncbi:MAG: (d)CMP kinase [Planctomycetota bacterium]|jgi:cytidylate kinase